MDEQTTAYWDECARLATELRRQAAETAETAEGRRQADNLRVLELALWTASAECRWRAVERAPEGGAG